MSLVINHNMMAANVARNLNSHYANLSKSTQRLSTGMRINSAADDAAGLAIRELQRADIAAMQQGARNANDAISMIQVADGALAIIDEKLIRMKELAEQAATGTYDSTQRLMIESEYQAMASEITRIANATDFNGIHLLDGTLSGAHNGSGLTSTGRMKIHFGAGNDSAEDYYYVEIGCATAAALGLGNNAFVNNTQKITWDYLVPLCDKTSQAAYDYTYKQKYAEYYDALYQRFTTGSSDTAPMDTKTASTQADAIAKTLADSLAQADKEMASASLHKVLNDNYMEPYLTAYQGYLDAGKTPSEAQILADQDAAAAAFDAVRKVSAEDVATSGISALISRDALPPANKSGVDAIIDEGRTLAYDTAYKNIYNDLFADAVAKAVANTDLTGLSTTDANPTRKRGLSSSEVLAIHSAVNTQAAAQAETAADKVKTSLEEIAADFGPTGSVYQGYYNDALANGYPVSVAEKVAEENASKDAWNAMKDALLSGSAFGTDPVVPDDMSANVTFTLSSSLPSADQLDALLDSVVMSGTEPGKTQFDELISKVILDTTETHTDESFSTLKDALKDALADPNGVAYKAVYESAYSKIYNSAYNDAFYEGSPYSGTDLQLADIATYAADQAKYLLDNHIIDDIIDKITTGLQEVYDTAGNPELGWSAVKAALTDANYNSTGIGTTLLDSDDFDIDASNIPIHDNDGNLVEGGLNTSPIDGTDDDVKLAYQTAGNAGLNHLYDLTSSTALRDALHEHFYTQRYNEALNVAAAQGLTPLTESQAKELDTLATTTAKAITYTVMNKMAPDLQNVYDHAYDNRSEDSAGYGYYYAQNIANGMSDDDARDDALAKAGTQDAWTAVKNALNDAINGTATWSSIASTDFNYEDSNLLWKTGNTYITVTSPAYAGTDADVTTTYQIVGAAGMDAATSMVDNSGLYKTIYEEVYTRRYNNALDLAIANGIVSPTNGATAEQVKAMHAAADGTADTIATEVTTQIKNALQEIYRRNYDTVTTDSEGYGYYYAQNIAAGMTDDAAAADALEKARTEAAWNAVKSALTHANVNNTPFGINSTQIADRDALAGGDGLLGHIIDPSQLSYSNYNLLIPNGTNKALVPMVLDGYTANATDVDSIYGSVGSAGVTFLNTANAAYTHNITFSASTTGTDNDVEALYRDLGSSANTWINTQHGLNGGDEAMLAACQRCVVIHEEEMGPKLKPGGTISTQEAAQQAIVAINDAIVSKDKIRAHLGALQNRLENTITNLNTQAENLQAAESRISDVDVATEMTEFTRQQILAQSAVAMLAQANSLPQMAMQLIGG